MLTRIPTDAGFYVRTPDAEWPQAIARMQAAVTARAARMAEWERANHPGTYPDAAYWARYAAEKATIPVDYPMPWGHVMFGR